MTLVDFRLPQLPDGPIADGVAAEGRTNPMTFGWSSTVAFAGPYASVVETIPEFYGWSVVASCDWPEPCLTADGVDAPWETTR